MAPIPFIMPAVQFIREIFAGARPARRPVISFEFFPTKTDEGERTLQEKTIPTLMHFKPDFCSVTYGAGGGTQNKTLIIVDRIQRQHGLPAMAHLTCVNANKEEIRSYLTEARSRGIQNILALRGDPPGGVGEFQVTAGGFEFSYQLVDFIRHVGGFSIGVAGFPEGHVACKEGKLVDWQRLKNKIEHGADFVITQLFFNNDDYYEFRDYLVKLGVTVPLVPGIIPILSTAQIKKFTALSGAGLPASLLTELDKRGDNDEAVTQFGIDYATGQCRELLSEGAPGIHFYTLNKARSTTAILKNLGLA